MIIKATSALGHSSPKREQCDAVEQFVSGHNVFMFAYYIPHPGYYPLEQNLMVHHHMMVHIGV